MDSLTSSLDSETLSRRELDSERDQLKTQLEKASRALQATSRRLVLLEQGWASTRARVCPQSWGERARAAAGDGDTARRERGC